MVDEYVEEQGCFEQIKEAAAGVVLSPLIFLAACGVLFWNEGRAVKRAEDLEAGKDAVVTVDAEEPKSDNDGDLVHVTGSLEVDEPVSDPLFGVSTEAIVMERTVEMYQWEEDKEKKNDKTVYRYERVWSETHHDSSGFKESKGHRNPDEKPFDSTTYRPDRVTVGGFDVGSALTGQLDPDSSVALEESILQNVPRYGSGSPEISGNTIYLNGRSGSPEVGDVRVSFEKFEPQVASIAAAQKNGTLTSYESKKLNYAIKLIEPGAYSSKELFEMAETENVIKTWAFRAGGWIGLMIAVALFFKPLEVIAGSLPLVGWIAEDLVEVGTGLVAFLVGSAVAALVIAFGWLFYRPLLGIGLLVLGGGLIGGLVYLLASARRGRDAQAA